MVQIYGCTGILDEEQQSTLECSYRTQVFCPLIFSLDRVVCVCSSHYHVNWISSFILNLDCKKQIESGPNHDPQMAKKRKQPNTRRKTQFYRRKNKNTTENKKARKMRAKKKNEHESEILSIEVYPHVSAMRKGEALQTLGV